MQRIGKMPVNINAMSKREKRAVAMSSNARLFRGTLAWGKLGCSCWWRVSRVWSEAMLRPAKPPPANGGGRS